MHGINDPGSFENLSLEQFQRMLDCHYLGTLLVTKAAWPHMKAAGYGRVVNTTSEAILGILPRLTSYAAAKGSVLAFTRALAVDGRAYGIRVNGFAPRAGSRMSGAKSLSLVYDVPEETFAHTPLAPIEPASPAAVFLAHESCELSGQVLVCGTDEVHRLTTVLTRGITMENLTVEDVAANLNEIMDMTEVTEAQELTLHRASG
jgi:NAD(P)-dependent dehydrogenase (short-subunit alcohol dehydrogenase family)